MNHTAHIANHHFLNRRVLTVQTSDGVHKVHVEVSNQGRTELNYYFIKSDITQACDAALDLATEAFLGLHGSLVSSAVVEQVEAELKKDTNVPSNNTGATNGESNQEKAGQESSKQEASSQKKSRSKKSAVVETVAAPSDTNQEEMEEVESPYKEEKKPEAEPYNREDKASKASFSTFVTRLYKGSKEWKVRDDLKDISTKLHGMPFIKKDGSIHPDFEEKCKELFGLDEAAL